MTSLYITESGTYLRKQGGIVVVGRNNETIIEIPLEKLEDVTVVDSVQISSKLVCEFLEREIPLSWLSGVGKFFGTLLNSSFVDVNKHKKQFELYDDENFNLSMSRKVISAKVHNQLTILRRYNRNADSSDIETAIRNILAVRRNIFLTKNYLEIMGYEGIISRIYFSALGAVVPEEFKFSKRSKRPPTDPFNSMLSLGYSMLFNEIFSNVVAVGMHPYVGFLHKIHKGHPALASDLLEEWRAVIIDSLVLAVVNRNIITADMFDITENGCFLYPEGRKIFLQCYNKKLKSINQYLGDKQTFRDCIKKQCRNYVSVILSGDTDKYVPVELR